MHLFYISGVLFLSFIYILLFLVVIEVVFSLISGFS